MQGKEGGMYRFLFVMASLVLTMGCASASNERHTLFSADIEKAPEMVKIDAEIETLNAQTRALEEEYEAIEKIVLKHAKFEGESSNGDESLSIYVNENNAILVNDVPMSRNEFSNYLDKKLPKLCSPPPTLKIHAKADYDIAVALLEMIYAGGCSDVRF